MPQIWIITISVLVTVFGSSCGNIKNLQYLQGPIDTVKLSKIQVPEPRIQKGDLLAIAIFSDDPAATAAVITPVLPVVGSTGTSSGFLVDQKGNIQLFKLGIMNVEGMTQKQLSDSLTVLYVRQNLLQNPYIEVRFLNYKVTLIGEINKPGSYSLSTDKLSAFDAISLGGDITAFGRRDNVLVVREINGERRFGHLDFTKPDVFLSPYYYLQQNDMLIVDVDKSKAVVNDQTTIRNLGIATTIISTIVLIYSVFIR